jgi:hypothetical protein
VKKEIATEKSEQKKKTAQQETYIVPTFYNRINLKETSLMVTFKNDGGLFVSICD